MTYGFCFIRAQKLNELFRPNCAELTWSAQRHSAKGRRKNIARVISRQKPRDERNHVKSGEQMQRVTLNLAEKNIQISMASATSVAR